MANNGDVVTGGAAESAAVTDLLLDIGDDGTLRNGGEGKDVADGKSGVLSGIDELAGVHALVGNEGLLLLLELIGAVENDAGERGTAAGIVDDLLHNTTNVSMALGEVERAELGGSLPQAGVRREDAAATLTLVTDLKSRENADVSIVAIRNLCFPHPIIPNC